MSTSYQHVRAWAPAALVLAMATAVSACGPATTGGTAPGVRASVSATPSAPPVEVTVAPADPGTGVRLDTPITVSVARGDLQQVTVTTSEGTPLEGGLDPAGAVWTSTGELAAGTRYAVHVVATDTAGETVTRDSAVTTLTPATTAFPSVAPLDGSTVGVGMPIIVTLDEPVADDRRDEVERNLHVTTTPAPVEGSWSWQSDSKVQFRPKDYWPAQTDVHIDLDLGDVEVAPGVWGTTRDIDFTVGSAVVSTVDIAAHTMTVTRDGEVLRTIPITAGQSGHGGRYVTRSGTKVIMSLEESRQMDAETTGVSPDDPEYYNVAVEYAMRLTNSGEFLHAAPWSVASQGRANVSHGCTGMSTEDARWMFEHSKVGDVVVFTGTDRGMEEGNGFAVWNETWEDWTAGSALS
ncbi:Ig-like domain-containing protein [Paenibacillus sp. TRM 82003]|uniref:L,D-transpeptidase n=1 Tax=Kineococcus sp. TRM81007 TaxID=2925831 RepID=UPI001F5A7EE0|nr:Ig-like domain-containing protein [Kineococcus sp. TRM81007]MCI2239655.1 Ig-like domain-containing protein [Kineococcus sp. TRM81007]MCI3926781.1 Ig-like domain-containing protein [Paenibacillus sp. TRM 82003]